MASLHKPSASMAPAYQHTPVLLKESLEALAIQPQGTYVDLTFGGGGHAKVLLERLEKGGRLFAFDQDVAAAQVAQQWQHPSFTFIQANARFVYRFLAFHGASQVDGILMDLGVSSYQIDTAERGFSIRYDAPLDMRMDRNNPLTAQQIVNMYDVEELTHLLATYGEVPHPRTLAQAIVQQRATKPLQTTGDLCQLLQRFAPRGRWYKYAARVFQALRIVVNDELGALKEMLVQSARLLKPGGRLVVLSYHSLEDRLVKRFVKTGSLAGISQKDAYGNVLRPLKPLPGKQPIVPTQAEVAQNPRARSAKLRVGVKL